MRSAEFGEFAIVKRLCAEAGAVDSKAAKRFEFLARHAAGIYFECDFRSLIDLELFGQCRENAIQLCRRKQRRRAPTEIDRIDIRAAVSRRSYLFDQRRNVTFSKFTLIKTRSEVAVGTTRATKWNMNVETC